MLKILYFWNLNETIEKIIFTIRLFVFLLSCEPDDICLTSIEDTPKLIIGFYEQNYWMN